jgi:iron-sulfur cluster insertion protein
MSLFFRSAAAKKVKELLSAEAEDLKDTSLRVFVKGGGCSGFQYEFIFDKQNEEDKVVVTDGVTLVVDPLSFEYLKGSEIDYSTGSFASQFVIHNPNVQTTCGCGSSFAL